MRACCCIACRVTRWTDQVIAHRVIIEGINAMEIKRPIELAGLKSRLARAKATEAAIEVTGKRFDAVLDRIDELHGVSRGHVGQLEAQAAELASTIDGMVSAGSNGGPNDGQQSSGASSNGSSEIGQIISSKTTDQ